MLNASLDGRHILVVGGSRGIGAACALACAEAGAFVSIVYRADARAAGRMVEMRAPKIHAFRADATQEDELRVAIDEAVARQGSLDGLVVSAGIFEGCGLAEMSVEFWDRTMAHNLRSTFLSVKHAVPHMDGGSIVIVTSTAGQRGSAVYSAYATSKGAQILFMRSMALELAPKIRVNCVAPAWTDTDMAAPTLDKLGRDNVGANFVLGRIGQPEDVAGATLFLLSDLARFVTGTTVTVDGGMDMRG